MNKPVAWMREDGVIAFHKQKEVDSQGYKWQPLYTHAVKELTDEEIEKVFYDTHFGFKGRDDSDFMDFTRVILRKAQET